ncbi:MAG: hypothetical protein ACYC4R_05455 [Anaerolineae bacterium]
MLYKQDLAEAQQRLTALWNGEMLGRPVISLFAPNGLDRHEIPEHDDLEKHWLDFEYRLERAEENIRCTYYGGEALPYLYLNMSVENTALCLGAEHIFSREAVWAVPLIDNWERDLPKVNPDFTQNPWWQQTVAFAEAAVEWGRGKFFVSMADIDGGGDACAALRDSSRLCIDMMDAPKYVHQLVDIVRQADLAMWDHLASILVRHHPGNVATTGWWGPPDGRHQACRNDFSGNVSAATYREFFLGSLLLEMAHFDYVSYHLDGPHALHLLDTIASIPHLRIMQWSQGPHYDAVAKLRVYKRAQELGKTVLVESRIEDIPLFLEHLDPARIWLSVHAESKEQAEAVLKWLERKNEQQVFPVMTPDGKACADE